MSQHPVIDQVAHVSVAILGLLPFALAPGPLTGAFAGMVMGFVREITEQGPLVQPEYFVTAIASPGHRLDISFWTLGGFIAGLLGELLK
jgi:thiamine transporter ThiT